VGLFKTAHRLTAIRVVTPAGSWEGCLVRVELGGGTIDLERFFRVTI
jgi:hypothetical protein